MAGQSDSDEDKTEEPSSQRLEDYRKEGQVAQSKELTSLFVLLSTMAVMWSMGPGLASNFLDFMRKMFAEAAVKDISQERAGNLLMLCLNAAGSAILPIAAAGFLAGIVGSVAQIGFNFTWTPLEPKGDRINPISGFMRIASLQSLMEGAKSLAKLIVVVWITFKLLAKEVEATTSMLDMDGPEFVSYMTSHGFKLMGGVCIGLFVVASLDFAYQKFKYHKSLMMTKAEVKQEHKQKEGDPLLKARIRSMQREMSRKRMMADVPKADVIVTNPTHYAVALRYDAEKMAAPRVVAKGADLVAQRIKDLARQHGIPMVENVPLARTLHKSVKVGGTVPKPLYQAVAEVLAYVYRLKNKIQ
ncbi:MAG: flagellar biosynthesis protein FlhB [Proteobacteria bacterium]|nr:MAG: flagellar biosynthesis protein FlhB [Pseudomonadota bacterium]